VVELAPAKAQTMLNEAKVTVFPMRGFVSLFQDQRQPREKSTEGIVFVETEVTKVSLIIAGGSLTTFSAPSAFDENSSQAFG